MTVVNKFSRNIALFTFLLSGTVHASERLDEAAVFAAVEAVVAEHRLYATCLSLDPLGYDTVQKIWELEVQDGLLALTRMKASPVLLARVGRAVSFDSLIDADLSLGEAIRYCHENMEQVRKLDEFGYTRLVNAIEKVALQD